MDFCVVYREYLHHRQVVKTRADLEAARSYAKKFSNRGRRKFRHRAFRELGMRGFKMDLKRSMLVTTKGFSCLVCGGTESQPFLSDCVDYYMGNPGSFNYRRCSSCELVQINPIPADMSVFYESYQVHQRKSRIHDWMRKLMMSKGYFFPNDTPALKILDFGSGDGWFMQETASIGHDVYGFEPWSLHASDLSKLVRRPVYSDADQLVSLHENTFDLVTMHYVVEHLSDLKKSFAIANRVLKSGGKLQFLIPNIESREFRIFSRKWHGLDAPRHISFLTPTQIECLSTETDFTFEYSDTIALPNDLAGTLSVLICGKYNYRIFMCCIPLAMIWCQTAGNSSLRVTLKKT